VKGIHHIKMPALFSIKIIPFPFPFGESAKGDSGYWGLRGLKAN